MMIATIFQRYTSVLAINTTGNTLYIGPCVCVCSLAGANELPSAEIFLCPSAKVVSFVADKFNFATYHPLKLTRASIRGRPSDKSQKGDEKQRIMLVATHLLIYH